MLFDKDFLLQINQPELDPHVDVNSNRDDEALSPLQTLPSIFVPEAEQDNVFYEFDMIRTANAPAFNTDENGFAVYASEADFDNLDTENPVFYTGILGHGIGSYFYHWFYSSKDLKLSIILPCPNVFATEETQQGQRNAIAQANDFAATTIGAIARCPALLENHPEARLHIYYDWRGLDYKFYQDDKLLDNNIPPRGTLR